MKTVSRKSMFCKTVSLFLVFTFSFYNMNSFADAGKSAPAMQNRLENSIQAAGDINISIDIGTIKSRYNGKKDKLIIHIQDAHCNYEAQRNISRMLEQLTKNYGINMISVEGAEGILDTKWFRAFPDAEIREKVAEEFVKTGKMTGSEFFSIISDYKGTFFGAERGDSYVKNLRAFAKTYPYSTVIKNFFLNCRSVQDRLKRIIYTPDLKELDLKIRAFDEKEISLSDFAAYLAKSLKKNDIPAENYTDFGKLTNTLEYEAKIDFETVDEERSRYIDSLSRKISEEEMTELVAKSIEFKEGRLKTSEFYSYLRDKARDHDIQIYNEFPNLFYYYLYAKLYDGIDNEKLFKEMDEIKAALKNKLCINNEQRLLDKYAAMVDMHIRLIDIELTNDDYKLFEKYNSEFSLDEIIAFLGKLCARYNLRYHIDKVPAQISENIPNMIEFYETAMERDKILVSNTLRQMDKENKKAGILITGGFHTRGIQNILEKRKMSYIVVTPRITENIENNYIEILTSQSLSAKNAVQNKGGIQKAVSSATVSFLSPVLSFAFSTKNILRPEMKRDFEHWFREIDKKEAADLISGAVAGNVDEWLGKIRDNMPASLNLSPDEAYEAWQRVVESDSGWETLYTDYKGKYAANFDEVPQKVLEIIQKNFNLFRALARNAAKDTTTPGKWFCRFGFNQEEPLTRKQTRAMDKTVLSAITELKKAIAQELEKHGLSDERILKDIAIEEKFLEKYGRFHPETDGMFILLPDEIYERYREEFKAPQDVRGHPGTRGARLDKLYKSDVKKYYYIRESDFNELTKEERDIWARHEAWHIKISMKVLMKEEKSEMRKYRSEEDFINHQPGCNIRPIMARLAIIVREKEKVSEAMVKEEEVVFLEEFGGATDKAKRLEIAYKAAKSFGANKPFTVEQFAKRMGVETAPELLQELWLKNKKMDTIKDINGNINYVYMPIGLPFQVPRGMKPEDFPVGVPMRVIIGHSEVRDYQGMTIEEIRQQADAFRKAGFKVILAFGDFPVELAGKNYLESGLRKFDVTYKKIKETAFDTWDLSDREYTRLYSEAERINNFKKLDKIKSDKEYGDYYNVLKPHLEKEFEKLVKDATAVAKEKGQRRETAVIQALKRNYRGFFNRAKGDRKDYEFYSSERDTKELISSMIDLMVNDLREVKKRITIEVSTVHEVNSQVRVLFTGVPIPAVLYQLFEAYEPVASIRGAKIPRAVQRLRKKKMIPVFVEAGIPADSTKEELIEIAKDLEYDLGGIRQKTNIEIIDELRAEYRRLLEIIYGGGAAPDNMEEVAEDFSGPFVGRAIARGENAPKNAAEMSEIAWHVVLDWSKVGGRPASIEEARRIAKDLPRRREPLDMIYNFKNETDGPFAAWLKAYADAGIDLEGVNISHGVTILGARAAFKELQGEDVSRFYRDASQDTKDGIKLRITIDARGYGIATRGVGANTGHLPAKFLRMAGVTDAIIDPTAEYAADQVKELVAAGITPVIPSYIYASREDIVNLQKKLPEEVAARVQIIKDRRNMLAVTPIDRVREVYAELFENELHFRKKYTVKPEETGIRQQGIYEIDREPEENTPEWEITESIKRGKHFDLTAQEYYTPNGYKKKWDIKSDAKVGKNKAPLKEILRFKSMPEAILGKKVIDNSGVSLPQAALLISSEEYYYDLTTAAFLNTRDVVWVVTDHDSKAWEDKPQVIIGFSDEAITKYKGKSSSIIKAYKEARENYQQALSAFTGKLIDKRFEQLLNEYADPLDTHIRSTIAAKTELVEAFDNASQAREALDFFHHYVSVDVGDVLYIPRNTLHFLPAHITVFSPEMSGINMPVKWNEISEFDEINTEPWQPKKPALIEEVKGKYKLESLLQSLTSDKFFMRMITADDSRLKKTIEFSERDSCHILVLIKGGATVTIKQTGKGPKETALLSKVGSGEGIFVIPASSESYAISPCHDDTKIIHITIPVPEKLPLEEPFRQGKEIEGTGTVPSRESGIIETSEMVSDLKDVVEINGKRRTPPSVIENENRPHKIIVQSGGLQLVCKGGYQLLNEDGSPAVFGPKEVVEVSMDHKKGKLNVTTSDGREFHFPEEAQATKVTDYWLTRARFSETVVAKFDYEKTDEEKAVYAVHEMIMKHRSLIAKKRVDLIFPREMFAARGRGSVKFEQRILNKIFGKDRVRIRVYASSAGLDQRDVISLIESSLKDERGRIPVLGATESNIKAFLEAERGYKADLFEKVKVLSFSDLDALDRKGWLYAPMVLRVGLLQGCLTPDDITEAMKGKKTPALDMLKMMRDITRNKDLNLRDLFLMLAYSEIPYKMKGILQIMDMVSLWRRVLKKLFLGIPMVRIDESSTWADRMRRIHTSL